MIRMEGEDGASISGTENWNFCAENPIHNTNLNKISLEKVKNTQIKIQKIVLVLTQFICTIMMVLINFNNQIKRYFSFREKEAVVMIAKMFKWRSL